MAGEYCSCPSVTNDFEVYDPSTKARYACNQSACPTALQRLAMIITQRQIIRPRLSVSSVDIPIMSNHWNNHAC
jgi:hypothetical protein|eukprot:COSAG01_NODE_2999_length_6737_cov_54.759114_5_plen_74_part_00